MSTYELSLRENATDSFSTGVSMFLDRQNPFGWKYSLMLIGQAVELFLKARLFEIDPSAIYKTPNDNSRTVNYEECIQRLAERDVALSSDEINCIKYIRRLRNQVEHSAPKMDQATVDTYVAKSLLFLDGFLYDNLEINVIDIFTSPEQFQEFKEATRTAEDSLAEATSRMEDQLPLRPKDRFFWEIVPCPECYQHTVALDERRGPVRCHHCGNSWENVEECARCASAVLTNDLDDYPHFCGFC